MDNIQSNLVNVSWWFDGFFFILVGIFLAWIFKNLPAWLKIILRSSNAKRKRKIKSDRWNSSMIHYQITKSQSRFLMFIAICFTYLVWYSFGSLNTVFEKSFLAGIFLSSPIYIIEIFWLIKDEYVKDLIKSKDKIKSYTS